MHRVGATFQFRAPRPRWPSGTLLGKHFCRRKRCLAMAVLFFWVASIPATGQMGQPLCRFSAERLIALVNRSADKHQKIVSLECIRQNSSTRWLIKMAPSSGYYTTGRFFRSPILMRRYDGSIGKLLSSSATYHVVQPRLSVRRFKPSSSTAAPLGLRPNPPANILQVGPTVDALHPRRLFQRRV